MLIHAASVNRKRAGLDKPHSKGYEKPESYKSDEIPRWHGKRIDQLTTEQYQAYLNEQ